MTSEVDPIVVVGKRKRVGDKPYFGPDGGSGGVVDGGGWGGGSAGMTQGQVDLENKRQMDCAANKAAEAIKAKPNSNKNEWFSHVFKDANDNTAYHAPRGGAGAEIPVATFDAARAEFGIASSNVLAIIHNHPADEYCNGDIGNGTIDPAWKARQIAFNQFPSDNDWGYAASLNNPDLTLYVVGCDGLTRSFKFAEMSTLRPLVDPLTMPTAPIPPLRAKVPPSCT